MVSSKSGLGCCDFSPATVRKSGIGTFSTGGSCIKRNPMGVYVALAKLSNCLSVGLISPLFQSLSFGNRLIKPSMLNPERLQAQSNISGFTVTRLIHLPLQ